MEHQNLFRSFQSRFPSCVPGGRNSLTYHLLLISNLPDVTSLLFPVMVWKIGVTSVVDSGTIRTVDFQPVFSLCIRDSEAHLGPQKNHRLPLNFADLSMRQLSVTHLVADLRGYPPSLFVQMPRDEPQTRFSSDNHECGPVPSTDQCSSTEKAVTVHTCIVLA